MLWPLPRRNESMDINSILQKALAERAEFLETAREAFLKLYPDLPNLVKRGRIQKEVLDAMGAPHAGSNKARVSEALLELGYKHVKNIGVNYLRRGYDKVTNRHLVGYEYKGNG